MPCLASAGRALPGHLLCSRELLLHLLRLLPRRCEVGPQLVVLPGQGVDSLLRLLQLPLQRQDLGPHG